MPCPLPCRVQILLVQSQQPRASPRSLLYEENNLYRNLKNHWTNIWKSNLTQSPCSRSHQKQKTISMKLCLFRTMLLIITATKDKALNPKHPEGPWRCIIHSGHLQPCAPRAGSSSERAQTGPNGPPVASLLFSILLGFTCHYSSFTKFSKF